MTTMKERTTILSGLLLFSLLFLTRAFVSVRAAPLKHLLHSETTPVASVHASTEGVVSFRRWTIWKITFGTDQDLPLGLLLEDELSFCRDACASVIRWDTRARVSRKKRKLIIAHSSGRSWFEASGGERLLQKEGSSICHDVEYSRSEDGKQSLCVCLAAGEWYDSVHAESLRGRFHVSRLLHVLRHGEYDGARDCNRSDSRSVRGRFDEFI